MLRFSFRRNKEGSSSPAHELFDRSIWLREIFNSPAHGAFCGALAREHFAPLFFFVLRIVKSRGRPLDLFQGHCVGGWKVAGMRAAIEEMHSGVFPFSHAKTRRDRIESSLNFFPLGIYIVHSSYLCVTGPS